MARVTAEGARKCSARGMDVDARIWKLGETQRGHVTRAQARAEGMTRKQLHHRRRRGSWVEVMPDVFRLPGVPETREGTLMAIQLWMGPDGHYCGPTAIYLYGLDGAERPDRFNVALHTGGGHPLVKVHRLAPHDRPPTRGLDGLRVVRLERALAEMVAARPPPLVGRALDDALRKKLTTLPRMKWFLETEWGRGRRGTRVQRHRLLMAAGYEILYFTWDEVVFAPDAVEAEIRAAIARRAAQLATSSSQGASQATRVE